MKRIVCLFLLVLTSCASKPPQAVTASINSDLKLSSSVGRLKAKLTLTNTSGVEMVVNDLDPTHFRVETVDGKSMPFKGKAVALAPVHVPPGKTVEESFDLAGNYPFWDRRTKYRVWYDGPGVRSNVAQVWF